MAKVTMKGGALDAAHSGLEDLASKLEVARTNIRRAIPDRVATPSLAVGGPTTSLPYWLRAQKNDPIGVVRDLAHLLDDGAGGEVSVYVTGDDTMEGLESALGRQIAEEYADVPAADDEKFAKWAEYLHQYGDIPAVMAGVAGKLDTGETVSIIERSDRAGLDVSGFSGAAAEEAGTAMNDALTDPVGTDDRQDIRDSTAVLAAINANIAADGKLTRTDAVFIETWIDTVGAENLAGLSTTLAGVVPPTFPPGAVRGEVDRMMSPIGDSILNYSNPDVHASDAGIDRTPYAPYPGAKPDGAITLSEMPEAIQELAGLRIGVEGEPGERLGIPPTESERTNPRGGGTYTYESTGVEQFSDIQGLDGFNGWADLMASSNADVEGGESFSETLGHQALTARQDMNTIEESASDYRVGGVAGRGGHPGTPLDIDANFSDGGMSKLLTIASRNEDAAADIVVDPVDRHTLLMSDWDVPTGAQDLIRGGTDRDPADGGGTKRQADAALALMDDIAEDPERWQEIMDEPMKQSVVDVGLTWVDTFGLEDASGAETEVLSGPEARDSLGRPLNFQISLDGADCRQFMEFIAGSGDENATVFRAGMMGYGNDQLTSAMSSGEDDAVENALSWSARSEGRMDYAVIDSALDETEEKHAYEVAEVEQYNEKIAKQKAGASMIFDLASGSFGEALGMGTTDEADPTARGGKLFFPKPGPFLVTTGIGLAKDPILDAIFQSKDVPDFSQEEFEARVNGYQELQTDRPTARTYDQARLLAGDSNQYAQQYPHLYDHGTLRPLSDIKGTGLDDLRNLVDGVFVDDWKGPNPIDYQGSYVQQLNEVVDERDNDLAAWRDRDGNVVEDVRDNASTGRQALYDPANLQQALYGGNQQRYDDRPKTTAPQVRSRPNPNAEPNYGPYDYEPTDVGPTPHDCERVARQPNRRRTRSARRARWLRRGFRGRG